MTIRTAPGPRGGPIVGSALEIGRDPLRAYTRYARTYGDVVSARFLRWRLQFFFHPEHVAHILQRNQANYSKDLYTYHLLRPAVGNGLVTNDGWRCFDSTFWAGNRSCCSAGMAHAF